VEEVERVGLSAETSIDFWSITLICEIEEDELSSYNLEDPLEFFK
jgi:hypothetical protein